MAFRQLLHVPIPAKRIYGLDLLRACAILWVMLSHAGFVLTAEHFAYSELIGFDGVSLFFVLSGFLIGGILVKTLDTKKANWSTLFDFWLKRWFRTVPPYMFVLLVLIAANWQGGIFKLLNYYKAYFVFLQNFKSPHSLFFQEAWSLSVEEWFYLLVPSATFVLIYLTGKAKNSLLLVAIAVLLLVTAYRYYKYLHFPPHTGEEWDLNYRKIVVTRLDSLMYGVIGAWVSYYYNASWLSHKGGKMVVGVALLLLSKVIPYVVGDGLYNAVFSFSLTSIGTVLMLPYLSTYTTGSGRVSRLLTRISLISYSMYLLNFSLVLALFVQPLLKKLALTGTPAEVVGYVLFWVVTSVLSILMYKYLELPVMRLRNKVVAQKEQSVVPISSIA